MTQDWLPTDAAPIDEWVIVFIPQSSVRPITIGALDENGDWCERCGDFAPRIDVSVAGWLPLPAAGFVWAGHQWRPIETAPVNIMVIAYMPWIRKVAPAIQYKGFRHTDDGWKVIWSGANASRIRGAPSHWQPYPEVPDDAGPSTA